MCIRDRAGLDKVHNMTYQQKVDWLQGMWETLGKEKFASNFNFLADRSTQNDLIKSLADRLEIDLTPPPTKLETELGKLEDEQRQMDNFDPRVDDLIKLPPSFNW